MTYILRLLQLALSALIAAAAGGLILVLMIALATIAAGVLMDIVASGGGGASLKSAATLLAFAFFVSGMAVGPAIGTAWLATLVFGSALWAAGRNRDWPRGRLAWALAGAATALICYFRLYPSGRPPYSGLFPLPPAVLAATFMLTGAAAGQVFRSTLAATSPFFGFDEEEDEGTELMKE